MRKKRGLVGGDGIRFGGEWYQSAILAIDPLCWYLGFLSHPGASASVDSFRHREPRTVDSGKMPIFGTDNNTYLCFYPCMSITCDEDDRRGDPVKEVSEA